MGRPIRLWSLFDKAGGDDVVCGKRSIIYRLLPLAALKSKILESLSQIIAFSVQILGL